jgi:hypothetical protein
MCESNKIWEEGMPKWTWPEHETVPRYKYSQVRKHDVVKILNENDKLFDKAHQEIMEFVSWLEDQKLLLGNWSIMWNGWRGRP